MSAVEVMVAVVVAAAVGIPMLSLLLQERDTEQRSRFEYAALLAARDEAYQARVLAVCGIPDPTIAHDFRALQGNPLDSLGTAFTGTKSFSTYSLEQKRVSVKLKLDPPAAGSRVGIATVTARWMDAASGPGQRRTSLDLVSGVLKPAWLP